MTAGLRIGEETTRSEAVRFRFDGAAMQGFAGESVAVALLAAGVRALRQGPGDGGPRGMFCAMGTCQECVVLVDGVLAEACRTPLRDGLEVRRAPLPDGPDDAR